MIDKMKKSFYILWMALGLVSGACTDWLTVQPETTIVADHLYTTDAGVEQALNGTYILMKTSVYNPGGIMGGAGFAEGLAATWSNMGNDLNKHIYNINNEFVGSMFDGAFMGLYKIISNATPLINGMEQNKELLSEEVYNIVKGEALAIRACVHLDLIRLWGPMPTKVDRTKTYLPYVTEYSTSKYTYHTYDEYMEKLFADLNEAEALLKKSDPILNFPANNTTNGSTKWLKRQCHFNYYGVLGLQSRARLWYGDKEEALRYAKMVKEAVNTDGTPKFKLGDQALFSSFGDGAWDGTMYPEHLCGVDVSEVFDYNKSSFGGTNVKVEMTNMAFSFLELYDNNTSDLRFQVWLYSTRRPPFNVTCRKYECMRPDTRAEATNMPVVRLSEMYLTIMECGTLTEANAAFEEFCTARKMTYVPLTEGDRKERVTREFIKELMAEGQNFFTYKRNEVKRMFNQPEDSDDCDIQQYVLPLPPKEF